MFVHPSKSVASVLSKNKLFQFFSSSIYQTSIVCTPFSMIQHSFTSIHASYVWSFAWVFLVKKPVPSEWNRLWKWCYSVVHMVIRKRLKLRLVSGKLWLTRWLNRLFVHTTKQFDSGWFIVNFFTIFCFTIATVKLTRGCCFLFIGKRVGRIMEVAIFESFFFPWLSFSNLDNFSTSYDGILIKSNSKLIFFKVNLS